MADYALLNIDKQAIKLNNDILLEPNNYYTNLCCLSRETQVQLYIELIRQFNTSTLPFSHLILHTLLFNCLSSVPETQNILILSYEALTSEIASYIELFHPECNIELITAPYDANQTDFTQNLSRLLHTYQNEHKSFQIALFDMDIITWSSCTGILPNILDYDAQCIAYSRSGIITDFSDKILQKHTWTLEDMIIEKACLKTCANYPSVLKIKELLSLISSTDLSDTEKSATILSQTIDLENYIITNRKQEHTYFYCHWINEMKNALLNLNLNTKYATVYLNDLRNAMGALALLLPDF